MNFLGVFTEKLFIDREKHNRHVLAIHRITERPQRVIVDELSRIIRRHAIFFYHEATMAS